MTLELGYWIALGIGVGFLLLSIVAGDLFDFIEFDFGDGFAATPVIFTALASFGAGGLLGVNAFGLGTGGSVIAGLAAGVALGGLAAFFFRALGRQEAKEEFATSQLMGSRGQCTLAIVPGKSGRVSVQHLGMTRTFTATSDEPIAVGEDIVVVDVIGQSLKVKKDLRST